MRLFDDPGGHGLYDRSPFEHRGTLVQRSRLFGRDLSPSRMSHGICGVSSCRQLSVVAALSGSHRSVRHRIWSAGLYRPPRGPTAGAGPAAAAKHHREPNHTARFHPFAMTSSLPSTCRQTAPFTAQGDGYSSPVRITASAPSADVMSSRNPCWTAQGTLNTEGVVTAIRSSGSSK